MTRTVLGYEMRAVGHNPEAARFAGMPVNARADEDGAALGRAGRRSPGFSEVVGPQGQPDARSVAGLWLLGIVVAMLALLQPARRRRGGDLRRRHLRRRRRDEPGGRRAELHRRRHGRRLRCYHGHGDPAVRASGCGGGDGWRRSTSSSPPRFWAAAVRIASPLIFATHGRADLRAGRACSTSASRAS